MADRRGDHLYSVDHDQKRPMVIQHVQRNRPTPPPPPPVGSQRGSSPYPPITIQTPEGAVGIPMQGSPIIPWQLQGLQGAGLSPENIALAILEQTGGPPMFPMHGSPLSNWAGVSLDFLEGRLGPLHSGQRVSPRPRSREPVQSQTPPRASSRGTPPGQGRRSSSPLPAHSNRSTPTSYSNHGTPPAHSNRATPPMSGPLPFTTNPGLMPSQGSFPVGMNQGLAPGAPPGLPPSALLSQYLQGYPNQPPLTHPDVRRLQEFSGVPPPGLPRPPRAPSPAGMGHRPPPPLHLAPHLLQIPKTELPLMAPQPSHLTNVAQQMLPEDLSRHEEFVKKEIKEEEEEELVDMPNPFNMRLMNLNNFPVKENTYRASYRSQTVAVHRAKAGSITSAAKSLDILRQTLQRSINKELDAVIQKYIETFFGSAVENIKLNNGENSVSDDHIQAVCRQMLEEAKKMYIRESRSPTPVRDGYVSDNPSEVGSLTGSHAGRRRKRRGSDTDSEASVPTKRINVFKKKGRPPLSSGRSTPSKTSKADSVKREGHKWDADRLKEDTLFIMGSKANKALGLGATRGRLYIKHPDIFKYSGDQDDKVWLYENHRMPATGGKAYLLLVEDMQELIESSEYRDNSGLMPELIKGFTVPDWMIEKMKIQMMAMRTDKGKKDRSRSATPMETKTSNQVMEENAVDADVESDKHLPFTNEESSQVTLGACKREQQPSPANTEEMELLSSHGEEDNPSPFGITGGFGGVSPAPGGSPSTSDLLDDAAPLTGPFELQYGGH